MNINIKSSYTLFLYYELKIKKRPDKRVYLTYNPAKWDFVGWANADWGNWKYLYPYVVEIAKEK